GCAPSNAGHCHHEITPRNRSAQNASRFRVDPDPCGPVEGTPMSELAEAIADVRASVAALHEYLPRYGLVIWTAGNVSERVPGQDLFVIKPTGVSYDGLTAEDMVVCDLDGTLVDGTRAPSSDTAAHAYVYRHMP